MLYCGDWGQIWGYLTDPGLHYRCGRCGAVVKTNLIPGKTFSMGPCGYWWQARAAGTPGDGEAGGEG